MTNFLCSWVLYRPILSVFIPRAQLRLKEYWRLVEVLKSTTLPLTEASTPPALGEAPARIRQEQLTLGEFEVYMADFRVLNRDAFSVKQEFAIDHTDEKL